jgi:hypothetical protein
MPRACTICIHPDRPAIDMALVNERAIRETSAIFRVSEDALSRHRSEHIPAALARVAEADKTASALDVKTELRRCFERVNLLFDACDRWLRDADDPSRYDIGPRASEMLVTYATIDETTGKTSMRKEPLSRLLGRVEGLGITTVAVETKHADPRELVLKTADRLRTQAELLAKLLGDLDDRPQVNVLMAPEWGAVRAALLEALRPYPEARTAAATRLVALESSA